jgi:hypothetical protein
MRWKRQLSQLSWKLISSKSSKPYTIMLLNESRLEPLLCCKGINEGGGSILDERGTLKADT